MTSRRWSSVRQAVAKPGSSISALIFASSFSAQCNKSCTVSFRRYSDEIIVPRWHSSKLSIWLWSSFKSSSQCTYTPSILEVTSGVKRGWELMNCFPAWKSNHPLINCAFLNANYKRYRSGVNMDADAPQWYSQLVLDWLQSPLAEPTPEHMHEKRRVWKLEIIGLDLLPSRTSSLQSTQRQDKGFLI